MAATNYTPISLYYSTTAAAVPVNTNLVNGELALNITDGKLYYKDNTGTVQLLASKAAAGGGVTTISFGTTGLTPNTATSGVVTVGGTLVTGNGGTGLTTFTSGGAVYATSTSALTTGTLPITAGGTGITAFGTGVQTALGQNVTGSGSIVLATSPTVTNPTVTNYVETLFTATGSTTIALTNGTIQEITTSGATTITLPASVTGKSFTVIVKYNAADSLTWAGGSTLKWTNGVTPTPTSAAGKYDIFNFYQDGTNTYGSVFGQNY